MITKEAPEIVSYKQVDNKLVGIDKDYNIHLLARLSPLLAKPAADGSAKKPGPQKKTATLKAKSAPVGMAPVPAPPQTNGRTADLSLGGEA